MNVESEYKRLIKILLKKEYPQQDRLSLGRFETFANEREVNVFPRYINIWEQLGLFRPIAKDEDIEGWDSFYHPYQIFRLYKVYHFWKNSNLPSYHFLKLESWKEQGNFTLESNLKTLKSTESADLKTLALLLQIEDYYLPRIRCQIVLRKSFEQFEDGTWEDWQKYVKNFNPKLALQKSNFSIEQIKQIRNDFAAQGHIIDPNFSLYPLIRHVEYAQRQRLKKEALFAWDYYDIAEMLGWLLEDVGEGNQPNVDDLTSGRVGWKKTFFGVAAEEIDYNKRNALPGILHYYGLASEPSIVEVKAPPPNPLKVFLCHSQEDSVEVLLLEQVLKDYGFEPWLAHNKLLPGQEWKREIKIAMENSDAVILCLSQSTLKKTGFVQPELKWAYDIHEQQPEGAIYMIPIKLENCISPQKLKDLNLHCHDFFKDNDYKPLLKTLNLRAEQLEKDQAKLEQ